MQQPTFQGRNFTANLDGVAVGSEVVAFHEQDLLWYRAVVDGKHSAPEHGGTYYTVTFKSVPGCKAEQDTVSPHLASRTTPARPSRSRASAISRRIQTACFPSAPLRSRDHRPALWCVRRWEVSRYLYGLILCASRTQQRLT